MSPATPWTELTGTATVYQEGVPSGVIDEAAILFNGLIMPIVSGSAFAGADVAWTEMTVPATSHTEMSVSSTAWTEVVL